MYDVFAEPEEDVVEVYGTEPPPQTPAIMRRALPLSAPDGTIMVRASKYSQMAVLTAFEMMGGTQALAEWAEKNPTDFYTKIFTKTIQRDVEVGTRDDVESMLLRLDKGEYVDDDAIDDAEWEDIEEK